MDEKPSPKPAEQTDSPQVAHLKFKESELTAKLKRLNEMSDAEFGDSAQGFNRRETIRRNQAALAEIQLELRKVK